MFFKSSPSMHYLYILKWQHNNSLYIGYTSDLARRLKEHKHESQCDLVCYEAYSSKNLAQEREKKLKYHGSAWRALRGRIV